MVNTARDKRRRENPKPIGRKPGVKDLWPRTDDKTLKHLFRDYRALLEKQGRSPVQIMVQAMLEVYDKAGALAAFPYAEKVAPYMYSKLSTIDLSAIVDETKNYVVSTGPPMTRAQWLEIWANPDMDRPALDHAERNDRY